MNYTQIENKVILTEQDSFNIGETLECGQCFRFTKIAENEYVIIAFSKVLHIKQGANETIFYPCTTEEFENIWIDYFDLKRDYHQIKKDLSKNDPILKEAINYAGGIRILNQEIWECLISFIISQNNRIPMIKQVIKNISEKYGNKIDDNYYSFPTFEQLKETNIDELMLCKTGFRAKYILDAVSKISNGNINIESFKDKTTSEVRDLLMTIHGVGPKVSDCVLLFSCKRQEVFPTDVWVKRVMEHFYFNGNETTVTKIHEFAKNKFGKNAGFAQQYLFHYARQQKIGV